MAVGSCLCGEVRYRIGALSGLLHCHCTMCRKAQGSAFRSRARVRVRDFEWLGGEGLVRYFQSSPGTHRGFCSNCGSPVLTRFDADVRHYGIALGLLDDDPVLRPTMHVHVASKAPWYDITDELPQWADVPLPT